jgi:membrane protein
MRVDRDRIVSELFFWLRPDFVLRCLRRFQQLEGFDRAIALASSAFTAMLPLAILFGALAPGGDGENAADHVIKRYSLTGEGAQAVRDAFAPPQGVTSSVGILGGLLLLIAALSFARAVQRLIERAWGLKPLSLRNTRNAALWIPGLAAYGVLTGLIGSESGTGLVHVLALIVSAVLGVGFILWTGRLLSARRVTSADLLPFAILVAGGLAVYAVVSDVWIPRLFNTYAARYGVIGATFAIISALFGATFVIVVMTAIGREITEELARLRRGERPPPDAVRREWDALIADVRARRDDARERYEAWKAERRERKDAPPPRPPDP